MNEKVYSKDIVEFVTVGVEFCGVVERCSESIRDEFVLTLARILPLLYLKATLLPDDVPEDDDDLAHYVTEEQYEYLRNAVSDLLGKDDDYLEVFDDDMAYSDTPIAATISEGIADIYQDIRDLLEVYRYGNETLSRLAVCRCRENFISYWGQQLVNIMRPLHSLCFGEHHDAEEEAYDDDSITLHPHHHGTHAHACDDPHCDCHHDEEL